MGRRESSETVSTYPRCFYCEPSETTDSFSFVNKMQRLKTREQKSELEFFNIESRSGVRDIDASGVCV